jgi:hypothetical protein
MKPRRWHAWERREKCRKFWWESLKERDHSDPILPSTQRCRWENGIRMALREIGWGGRDIQWIQLAQDRDRWRALVNTVMNQRVLVPQN